MPGPLSYAGLGGKPDRAGFPGSPDILIKGETAMAQPLLTVGIIFKNELRCLERCLKSLQPLREAISCEVVMADTGSTDGSREIAERYADVLFDFPWINDFSAARNAVINRSSGIWYLTIDSDEWLDPDISELVSFLRAHKRRKEIVATVVQRNYLTPDFSPSGELRDFLALRLVRPATGLRYVGTIHEHFMISVDSQELVRNLPHTVLHHDGYVGLNDEAGREKRERNLSLIRENLEKDPQDLTALMQYIESGTGAADYNDRIRQAVEAVKSKKPGWEKIGAPILRYAVGAARDSKLPELVEWIELAEEWFPDSYFTRIDVGYIDAVRRWDINDYEGCIQRGRSVFQAMADFRAGKGDIVGLAFSTLQLASPRWEKMLRIILSRSYCRCKEYGKSREMLASIDCTALNNDHTRHFLGAAMELQRNSDLDLGPLLINFYDEICKPQPTEAAMQERIGIFLHDSSSTFAPRYRLREDEEGCPRHDYSLYAALSGKTEIGIGAAILETESVQEMEEWLGKVENWDLLPIAGLEHALLSGVSFPLPGRPFYLEEADELAGRISQTDTLYRLSEQIAEQDFDRDFQRLVWARGVVLAAIQTYDWQDGKTGMAVCRAFANVERQFLPEYYTAEALLPENISALPSLHRFGWYCAQAFQALDAKDAVGYARLLREGLASCKLMKPAVEFLTQQLERQQEERRANASPELLALAEQVRMLMSMYSPDDPAVVALKSSAAYQQVADLIEGPAAHEMGGRLPQ